MMSGAPSISSDAAAGRSQPDRTESLLKTFRATKKLRDLKDFGNGKMLIHFHISAAAETLIRERNFEIRDEQFDLEQFSDAVAGLFLDSIDYFFTVVPNAPIREFHLLIEDTGEARQTNSAQAWQHSRVMQIDIRRWHKMYRGRSTPTAYSSSIHEFTHIVNYALDGYEDQYHRELTAILFETMNYIRKQGMPDFEETYLRRAPLKSPDEVLSQKYIGNGPLRYLAHAFIRKALDGTYVADATLDTMEKKSKPVERFAAQYLAHGQTGNAGFNSALAGVGFKDSTGNPLTIEKIQQDLHAELTQ